MAERAINVSCVLMLMLKVKLSALLFLTKDMQKKCCHVIPTTCAMCIDNARVLCFSNLLILQYTTNLELKKNPLD